jgi:hypothetical protein
VNRKKKYCHHDPGKVGTSARIAWGRAHEHGDLVAVVPSLERFVWTKPLRLSMQKGTQELNQTARQARSVTAAYSRWVMGTRSARLERDHGRIS